MSEVTFDPFHDPDMPKNYRHVHTQASALTPAASTYPLNKFFKPATLDLSQVKPSVAVIERAFLAALYPPVPLTAEEKKRTWQPKEGSTMWSNDSKNERDWEQRGSYWVERATGHHARWRDAYGCYCCAGFPYFLPETMERFHKEFEMFKPILRVKLPADRQLDLTLCRVLEGPIGTCWGIRTKHEIWKISIAGINTYIQPTKAGLRRAIKTAFVT